MTRRRLLIGGLLAVFAAGAAFAATGLGHGTAPPAKPTVFASGLNSPRGIAFGPDGNLYVAEGGTGGTHQTTPAECDQVVPPVGPYSGAATGADIVKVDPSGTVAPVAQGFPSSQTAPTLGSLVSGVAAVAFIDKQLYGILAGAGCSHGIPPLANGQRVPNGVVRVNTDGTWDMLANLSAFQAAHPVKNPQPDDFEPDGTWYSMIAQGGALFAVEPNHGELDRIGADGVVRRVVDISASQGHIVPTSLTFHSGHFYFANLGTFPIKPGTENVYRLERNGKITVVASGLTAILGLAFHQGRLYVLETATQAGNPGPGSGAVVRVGKNGKLTTIASGLNVPTAMTFGPDGALYVSNNGYGAPPGAGQILRIALG
jgi:hypothetical protein